MGVRTKEGNDLMLEEVVAQLSKKYIDSENDWYSWREIKEDRLPEGIVLPTGNQYKKNIALKKKLSSQLKRAKTRDEKLTLFKYYISTWGGIHGNSAETMNLYCQSTPSELIEMGSKGIASWSKALCITDPDKYAIYDARVAASLNSIQIIRNIENKVLYPVLTSRNVTVSKGIKLITKIARKHNWKYASECRFYRDYLKLLESVSRVSNGSCNVSICTIEMLLFAKAEELVVEAFPNEGF